MRAVTGSDDATLRASVATFDRLVRFRRRTGRALLLFAPVALVAMLLFHVGGSSYILFSIFDGVPSIMTREPDGGSLAKAILNGANCAFLVPAVLAVEPWATLLDLLPFTQATKLVTDGLSPEAPFAAGAVPWVVIAIWAVGGYALLARISARREL